MASLQERVAKLEERVNLLEGRASVQPTATASDTAESHFDKRRLGWQLLVLAIILGVLAGPIYDTLYMDSVPLAWLIGLAGIVLVIFGGKPRQAAAPMPAYTNQPVSPVRQTVMMPPAAALNRPPVAPPSGVATAPAAPTASTSPAVPKESLEMHIGSYWFSRIGIVLLVFGVAFFLVYALRYFGPWGRIMIGLFSGLAIAGFGFGLRKTISSFGQILIGGGGAVLYFTAFASYGFEASQIVPDNATGQVIALSFMLAISAAIYLTGRKLAANGLVWLAFFLAYFTVNLGDVALFSLVALLLITAALVFSRGITQRPVFLLLGVLLTYITYARWIFASAAQADAASLVYPASFLLATYFALYATAMLTKEPAAEGAPEATTDLQANAIIIAVNGLGFVTLMTAVASHFVPVATAWGLTLLIIGSLHLVLGGLSVWSAPAVRDYRIWTGFGLVAILIGVYFLHADFAVAWIWLAFVVLLALLGLVRRSLYLLDFVYALYGVSFLYGMVVLLGNQQKLFGLALTERSAYFTLAALIGLALSYVLRTRYAELVRPGAPIYLSGVAAALVTFIAAVEIDHVLVGTLAVVGSAFFFALGLVLRDTVLRVVSYACSAVGLLWFLVSYADQADKATLALGPNLLSIGLLILLAIWVRLAPPTPREGQLNQLFSGAAAFQLWGYLTASIQADLYSLVWGLLAAGFLILGIAIRDRAVRWAGILLFFLTIGKLFLIDTIDLDPLFRIASFIALGLILLLLSYGYTRYRERLAEYL